MGFLVIVVTTAWSLT